MTTDNKTPLDVVTAQQQTSLSPDKMLHSANAGAIVWRVGQIREGFGTKAREAAREMADFINSKHSDIATVFMYEETFGTKDRIHWLMHLNTLNDYEALVRMGGRGDRRNGVFGWHVMQEYGDVWTELFVAGSVQETVLFPHRWGMFGAATEAMAMDASVSPLAPDEAMPRFVMQPASAQTALSPDRIVHSANAGVIMHRVAECSYEFRAEARVFARTMAENNNLNMNGLSSIFVYEEAFGQMDRVHMLIHMRSLSVFYLMMGLDARTDPDAPRASFIRDWISMEKGGGSWDRIIVPGTTRDNLLTPMLWRD